MRVIAAAVSAVGVCAAGWALAAAPGPTASPEEAHAGCLHTQLRACMISLGSALWFNMDLAAAQIAKRNELDINGRTAHRRIDIGAKVPGHTETIDITLTLASPAPNDQVVSVAVSLPDNPDLARTESEYDKTYLYDVVSVVLGERCPHLDKLALYRFYENSIKPREVAKVESDRHGSVAQSKRTVDTPKTPFCGAWFSLHSVFEWYGPPDGPSRLLPRGPITSESTIIIE